MPQEKLTLGPKEELLVKKLLAKAEKQTLKHMNELATRFDKRFRSVTVIHTDCQKNRAAHPLFWPVMESFANASMPPEALYTNSFKAMANLRAAIKGRKWKTLQQTIKAAEEAINKYDLAVTQYVNKVVTGANRSVRSLKFTKTVGMLAVGALCVTFAAPLATGALAEAGLVGALAKGTVTTAAIHGVLGSFIATQIKGVASATGKIAIGDADRIDVKGHIYDTAYQSAMGIFAGGAAKGIVNPKLAKLLGKNPKAVSTQIKTRLSVGTFKAALEDIYETVTKKRAPAVAKATAKSMTGRETQAEFENLAYMKLLQDPVFIKALAKALVKAHNKEREMGPFPKK